MAAAETPLRRPAGSIGPPTPFTLTGSRKHHDTTPLAGRPARRRSQFPAMRALNSLRLRLRHLGGLLTLCAGAMLSLPTAALPLVSAEAALLTLINDARSLSGLTELQLNDAMRTAALAQAQDMTSTGTLSHVGSDGKTLFDRLNDAGYAASPLLPSGLIGSSPGTSPDALFGLWMADASSSAVLTSASATDIGIGLGHGAGAPGFWSLVLNPVQPVTPGGGGSGGGTPAPTIDPLACAAGQSLADHAQCLLNDLRLRQGFQRLAQDAAMSEASAAHSLDMLTNAFVGHTGSDGSFFTERLDRAGYAGSALSEVVADGFGSLEAVLQAWLDSPDHQPLLLDARANEFGLGLAGSGNASRWTLVLGIDADLTTVPEPGALALVLLALCCLPRKRPPHGRLPATPR